jgi:hypothetical protein
VQRIRKAKRRPHGQETRLKMLFYVAYFYDGEGEDDLEVTRVVHFVRAVEISVTHSSKRMWSIQEFVPRRQAATTERSVSKWNGKNVWGA